MALTQIPTNIKVPLFYAQMDASGNATTAGWNPALIIGQPLTGTGSANTLYQVSTAAEVEALFGKGSMIHRQAIAYFAQDKLGEVYVYAVADPTGDKATGKITLTGTATASGILHLGIAGQHLGIGVSVGDTADDIGALIAAALPLHASTPTDYPVSAGNTSGVVTLTAKHKGHDAGNFLKLEVSPLGVAGRQTVPAGLTCVVTSTMGKAPMTPGSGDPDLSDLSTNISTSDFDMFVPGFVNDLSDLQTELSDATGRWGYERQQYGHAVSAYVATSSEETTFASGVDDQHLTVVGFEGNDASFDPKVANPPYELSAAFAGQCFKSLRIDPAQPCQTLAFANSLDGKVKFRAPAQADRWSMAVRNSLLTDGIATVNYSKDGKIKIEREVTTSKTDAFEDLTVLFTSMKWLRELRAAIEGSFGRSKLNALTLKAIKACVVAKFAELEALEITQDTEGFADSLVVQVNDEDPNRIDVLAAPQYVSQLRVVALNNRFVR